MLIEIIAAPLGKRACHFAVREFFFFLVAVELIERTVVVGAQTAEECGFAAGIGHTGFVHFRLEVNIVVGIGIVHALERRLRADIPVGIHVNLHTCFLGLLGGNHNHAVGSQCTVDRGCCRIFQHCDRFHIIGVDLIERQIGGHLVDNNQRLRSYIVRERAHTTKNRTVFTRVGIDFHSETGHLPFQCRFDVFVHLLSEFLAVNEPIRSGASLLAYLLITSAHDDSLLQFDGGIFHHYVNAALAFHVHLMRVHAQKAEEQH